MLYRLSLIIVLALIMQSCSNHPIHQLVTAFQDKTNNKIEQAKQQYYTKPANVIYLEHPPANLSPIAQEESLSQLQDLAGIRAWTGSHNADNNDLNKVGTLTAKFIATNQEVTLGASCSPATEDEKKNKPGKGGRAMIKLADGVFAPVFCDGTKWVREAQMAMSQCKVCIACKQKHPGSKTDEIAEKAGSWFRGACDYPDDDGWAVARDHLSGCGSNGRGLLRGLAGKHTQGINLAIKFVCGPDKTAGKFPSIQGSNKWATWQYHPSDHTNPEEYVTDEDK